VAESTLIKEILNDTYRLGIRCEKCGEPLYIQENELVRPRNCQCMRDEIQKFEEKKRIHQQAERRDYITKLFRSSMMGKRFQSRKFETYEKDRNKRAYDIAWDYVQNFEEYKANGKGLIFLGDVGTGKTHLAAAISNYLLSEKLQAIVFGTWASLLFKLRRSYDPYEGQLEREVDIIQAMERCDLLVLDDVGKEKQTDWSDEKLFHIIDSRYNNLLPIVITANYDLHRFERRIGNAIFSRLMEMCQPIAMNGNDYRLERVLNGSMLAS